MNKEILPIVVLLCLFTLTQSDQEITITVEPGSEDCFYETMQAGRAFELDYQVIDGGQGELDISFYLNSPTGSPLVMDYKKSDNSHRVDVPISGAYRFCFDNRFSTFNKKTVFFALFSEEDDERSVENFDTVTEEAYEITVAEIEDAVNKVKNNLVQIRHMQEQIRAWEARDRNVAEGNFARVNNWSILQIIVMLTVGFIQVVMVKSLFDERSHLNKLFRKGGSIRW